MKLHNIVISVLLLSVITLGFVTYINSLGDYYGKTADLSDLNDTRKWYSEMNKTSTEMTDEVNAITLDEGSVEGFLVPYRLMKAGWKAIKLTFQSFGTLSAMISAVFGGIRRIIPGVHPLFEATILTIIVIMIVFSILYMIFKWKVET